MAILLTGGAGYIGSHTAVALIEAGYDVIILDNLSNSDESSIDGIEKITGKRPKFYLADATKKEELSLVFQENTIDAVMHFAGYKAVGESVEKPLLYYSNNILSILCVLECMEQFGCHNIVFSSSSTVYGNSPDVPYDETHKTGDCSNPYARTKFFIEEILKDYVEASDNFNVVILRYFNPIGSHKSGLLSENPKGVPNNLFPYLCQLAEGKLEKLYVFGNDYDTVDGTGVRDYIHIEDIANGHVLALKYFENHRGLEIFNLGTGKGTSVFELINAFEKARGIKIPLEITKRRAGDVDICYANCDKAKKYLGFETKYTIEDACKIGDKL